MKNNFIPWPLFAFFGIITTILITFNYNFIFLILIIPFLFYKTLLKTEYLFSFFIGSLLGLISVNSIKSNPLIDYFGVYATFSGYYDGDYLQLKDPVSRVLVSPRPKKRGFLTVKGWLVAPKSRTNPNGFSQIAWFNSQTGILQDPIGGTVVKAVIVEHTNKSFKSDVQNWFASAWKNLDYEARELLNGIELGKRLELNNIELDENYTIRDAFARSGLTHILALSGQHIVILTAFLLFFVNMVNINIRFKNLILLCFLYCIYCY